MHYAEQDKEQYIHSKPFNTIWPRGTIRFMFAIPDKKNSFGQYIAS
jgi:hypothetical protein